MARLPVGVVGAGGFGRGIARAACRAGCDVILYSRQDLGEAIEPIRATRALSDLADAELIFMAVPSAHVEQLATRLGEHLDGGHLLVHVSRGLVGEDLTTLSQVLRRVTPCRRVGALGGPLIVDALESGQPSGCIVGSRFPEVASAVQDAIASPSLRVYETEDVLGVEAASAMVGTLSLALGYAHRFGLGPAALAVMATRGIAEAARLGRELGAEEATFHGLAGIGDLIAAVAGDGRPEFRVGQQMAKGVGVEEAKAAAGTHIEALSMARRVASFGERRGIELPITSTVALVMTGELDKEAAVAKLMARQVTRE